MRYLGVALLIVASTGCHHFIAHPTDTQFALRRILFSFKVREVDGSITDEKQMRYIASQVHQWEARHP